MAQLVLVPTPIGNLEDISERALRILADCDVLFAEDTRSAMRLLSALNLPSKSIFSFHLNNEHQVLQTAVERIANCQLAAFITDAGTPGISDPGFLLVRACIEKNLNVECLPGPVAFVPALVVSGLPCDRFRFEGFLPHKKGRETRFKSIAESDVTTVMYESPHRLLKTLSQIITFCGGERAISISREISKKFEETVRGSAEEVERHFLQHKPKGEFVVVISGKDHPNKAATNNSTEDT